ncbi:adenylyl cyclase-associated protein 1 isoform X1 [Drosophila guanche]|uniref:Adenylyl cyclase-associated protein n=2 Tax=Drosophila guanche TaxID=7266 RepID=A0A3B0JHY9_DROGU|nr:adenylyl cyclase-associated protein 1 isoform X1 [Drosophila guanche]SPP79922.1 blast:Adenylyl cyclase-associated protein 1 [Drosophila guanche]
MFSCCRANTKVSKKDKGSKVEEENEEVLVPVPVPEPVSPNPTNEKEEPPQLNGTAAKLESEPEPELKLMPVPEPQAEPEPVSVEADDSVAQPMSNDEVAKSDTVIVDVLAAPVTTEKETASLPSPVLQSSLRSTHSSTSTAPPASMTSAGVEDEDDVVVATVTPTTPPPQPPPTKSCLSRHNSTHQSIKKKVNISNRAEIIEPEPELPPLGMHNHNNNNGSLADDDEVFSDSLPPPKRESMCAPYIEGDLVSETLAFAHGLPVWFEDERLNEMGCIEPPVTPVGRDELELKRQRLYTELLRAAHAAVEHSVAVRENEPDAKPSAAGHLESICERLESLVDRLERTLIAPPTQSQAQPESIELPPPPSPPPPPPLEAEEAANPEDVLAEVPPSSIMSVAGFEDIVAGPLSKYLTLSAKIGGDVAQHAELVRSVFALQQQYVTLATQIAQPAQPKQAELLKPTSTQISAIQDYREKHRTSPFFNHLSAISESIPALGWVCVEKTPGPYVKEMNDAGQFYTNRVLKEWKEKDSTHVEWARSWVQTLAELQAYIKQYHTTGLVWSGKGAAPSGGAPPPPPPGGLPPPPPPLDLSALKLESGGDDRNALFAQINQGADITKNLKKVTGDMQTHKNPSLRTGPAPFKTPAKSGSSAAPAAPAVAKEPVFTRDGKKWLIEYQKNNTGLLVDNAEMNNVVYVFRCEGSTLTVKGKVNNIVLDSCKKCSLLFDSVVASVEFVNCQSVQMQVLGFVPTISIDKSDGCQMYLSKESLGVEIVSSKSSEMNILLPDASGDYTELAVPEQYKTTIAGKTLKTVCVDSLG